MKVWNLQPLHFSSPFFSIRNTVGKIKIPDNPNSVPAPEMEETEKMTALKKAYAEIILNTAKEAAARIIVSERRAQLYQRDLSATKEEALRIMLRVKQMIDLKMNEDETKSLIQRKRIDELEAQLHEAEDIVSNLRANLYETQAQLENVSRNQHRPLTEENAQADATNGKQNNPNNHTTSVVTRPLQPCHIEDCGKTDVMSRCIKPGLYRNGYTQRIQACDRKLLNGHLSLCEDPDAHKSGKLSGEENEGKVPVNGTESIKDSCAQLRLKRKRAMRRNRFVKDVSVAMTDNDLEVADALILITQESVSKAEEKENPISSQEKTNAQVSDLSDVISVQSPKSRIVKYTFQRKRKRESNQSISIDNSNSSPLKDNPIQTTAKEHDDKLDIQQMAHLACQRPS